MNRVQSWVVLLLLLGSSVLGARAQVFHPKAIDPHDFAIMAWGDSPSDPQQLYWMKEAGLNISGFCRPEDLERVNAAGLACFVNDPRGNHYDWENLPEEKVLDRNVEALVRQVGDLPGVVGFFLADEPRPLAMPGLGRVARLMTKALPHTWPYINLLPNYSPPEYLKAPDYETYLSTYLEAVHPPFISYDNYSLFDGKMLSRFYSNLEIVRRVSIQAGIPFWNCILANAHYGYMEPSDATLHLQVYATLAYGGRGIEYYTYSAPDAGNYRLAAVDQFGHRTPTWGKLQRINDEIATLAPWLIQLRSTGVYYSSPAPEHCKPLSESKLVQEVVAQDSENPPRNADYLIGEFEDRKERPYFMIVNKSLNHSVRFLIHLRSPWKRLMRISSYSGKEEAFGADVNWISPGSGILFRVE